MQKKVLAFISVLLLLTFVVTACSGNSAKPEPNNGESPKKATNEPLVIKLAHTVNEKDPYHYNALEFKEIVESKTNGKVKIEIFPNGVIGDERTLIEGMQVGTTDMGIITNGPIANFLPEIAAFEMPFLFASTEEAYKVLDGEVGQKVLNKLEQINIKGLAFSERGFRNLTNSKRAVKTPQDAAGLKVRVMENPVYIDTFKAIGINAVPMAWQEALTAFQSGAVEGQENPINVAYAFKLWESHKYLTLTRHTYAPASILMSKKLFDSLDQETQEIIVSAAKESAQKTREWIAAEEETQIQILKEQGMEIEENPDLEAFQKAVEPVYEKYGTRFADLIEEINKAK
ncbi:MAG: TRAP transporter substrate-binding protein DctP [Peptococcales bacterium]|jgi:tripartite ATP-independent transporter DctP family solute receptor